MTDRGGAGRSGPVERFDGETPSLLQSEWWRRVKAAGGWRAVATDPSVLQRKVGPFTLAYAPHAFEGNDNGARAGSGDLDEITAEFRDIGRRSGATLVRWDVPWHRDD
ncbi:MAG: hypothetical protein ACOCV0_06630, partial [Alkalispirochaeta sp.]